MSASKKTTKATKSPAPATKETKAAKPAAKKSAAKAVATPAKTAAASAAIVAAVARAAAPALVAPAASPAAKQTSRASARTIIEARIDVGFGNSLTVRGQGPGLSWDTGVPMKNIGADVWRLELGGAAEAYTFKFLINDLTWSVGPDYSLNAGESAVFTPEF